MIFCYFLVDGIRLPTSHRQRVHNNGTLIVAQLTQLSDDGEYSCTAEDRQGHSDSQSLSLKVMGKYLLFLQFFPFHLMHRVKFRYLSHGKKWYIHSKKNV